MELFEAIDRYNEDKNEMALYESVIDSETLYDEKQEILKDVLGDKYNVNTFRKIIHDSFLKRFSTGPFRPLCDKDFE